MMPPAQRIGACLRSIRNQQQLSLADVEAKSGGTWKAVVVGAYERGDRAVSLSRLAELARFYGVPLADILPVPDEAASSEPGRITIDLTRLEAREPHTEAIARFVRGIQARRGDHNGRMISLRRSDLESIALATGTDAIQLYELLVDDGVVMETARHLFGATGPSARAVG